MVHLQADHIYEFRLRRQRLSHVREFVRQIIRLTLMICVGTALAMLATSMQQVKANSERHGISRHIFDQVLDSMTPDAQTLEGMRPSL